MTSSNHAPATCLQRALKMERVSIQDMLRSGETVKVCAPMVRYSKLPFRTLVRKYACDVACTPMIVSESFINSQKARDVEFTTDAGDRPLVAQFAASNADDFAAAALLIAPHVDAVDLNCGCPQKWALAEGYGAHLIQHRELLSDMVKEAKRRSGAPVSIKIRIHRDLRQTVELVQAAEQAGVEWITVHGRTAQQRTEPVNFEAIKLVKESVSVPVLANGDIRTSADITEVVASTGVDGVMCARGILQNPSIFAGYDTTPLQCVQDWVDISLRTGVTFSCFHHHLMFMLEKVTTKSEKRVFNILASTPAVLDYLEDHYSINFKHVN